jgi:hypothetical protein
MSVNSFDGHESSYQMRSTQLDLIPPLSSILPQAAHHLLPSNKFAMGLLTIIRKQRKKEKEMRILFLSAQIQT